MLLSIGIIHPLLKFKLEFLIKEKEKITNRAYRMINNVSHTLANHELKDLVEKEILIIKGKGRATQYFLKS